MNQFWVLYAEGRDSPRYKYASLEEAKADAEAVARKLLVPVYVLQTIQVCEVTAVTWRSLEY